MIVFIKIVIMCDITDYISMFIYHLKSNIKEEDEQDHTRFKFVITSLLCNNTSFDG